MKIVVWLIAVGVLFMTGHYFWMIAFILVSMAVFVIKAEQRRVARRDGEDILDSPSLTKKEERELQKYMDSVDKREADEILRKMGL